MEISDKLNKLLLDKGVKSVKVSCTTKPTEEMTKKTIEAIYSALTDPVESPDLDDIPAGVAGV